MTIADSELQSAPKWNWEFWNFGLPDDSYGDFTAAVKRKMKQFSLIKARSDERLNFTKIFGEEPGKIDSILEAAYSPKNLNLQLATSADIEKYEDVARELWISGKCIAIRADMWEQIMGDDDLFYKKTGTRVKEIK